MHVYRHHGALDSTIRSDTFRTAKSAGPVQGLNLLRESLQWEILAALHSLEAFRDVAFIGGTCLRLLHGLGRFSEDLDFSTITKRFRVTTLQKWSIAINRHMISAGINNTELQIAGESPIYSLSLRWPELLKDAGFSALASQKMTIKLEVDANPLQGAEIDRVVRAQPRLMSITTFKPSSMMAGKLHALLARPYTKGRDWYDLLWYLGNGIEPNVTLLANSLAQLPSNWCDNAKLWKHALIKKTAQTDWHAVQRDLSPFLSNPDEALLLNQETIVSALNQQRLSSGLRQSSPK
jgi:hypothetical protein